MQSLLPKTRSVAPSRVDTVKIAAPLALGLAIVLGTLLALNGTVQALITTWYESNVFNHCFLIVPIAAYLGWQRRAHLAAATVAPEWRGVILVALAALVWLFGAATDTLIIEEVSLVIIVQALILTIFGASIFRILLFPLLFLFFAVPFGVELVPELQTVTAFLSVTLLKLVGVPVFSDGYLISVPSGNWYVADACSGIRYVIASLALGALFAGLMYVTWWRRLLVLVVAVIVPIIANGIRAFGIILLAYESNNELAQGIDHLIYGWLFFTLVSCLVLAVGMSFRETTQSASRPILMSAINTGPVLSSLIVAIIAFLPIGAARAYGDYIEKPPTSRAIDLKAPLLDGYAITGDDISDSRVPNFYGADAELHAAYQAAQQLVYLRVGYYLSERPGSQAITAYHELPGSPGMLIVAKGTMPIMVGNTSTSVRFQRVSSGNGGRVIWYWYWVDGRTTGNPYFARLLEAKAKLLGGAQAAAIVAIAADYRSNPDEAEASLRALARQSANLESALAQALRP
jgi:exosortase A